MTRYRYLVAAYFLPRGMTRQGFDGLGLDALSKSPKELRPDPKTVRDAVGALKKLGFGVSRIDRAMLTIQANDGLLAEQFGVAYVAPDPTTGAAGEAHFVKSDGSGLVMRSAPPLKEPLASLLHIIAPLPTVDRYDPKLPIKLEPWHVWPEEIRERLGGVGAEYQHWQGEGASISFCDSGINTQHDQITKVLGIATTGNPQSNQLRYGQQALQVLKKIQNDFESEHLQITNELKIAESFQLLIAELVRLPPPPTLQFFVAATAVAYFDRREFFENLMPGAKPASHIEEYYNWINANRAPNSSNMVRDFLGAVQVHQLQKGNLPVDNAIRLLAEELVTYLRQEQGYIGNIVNWAQVSQQGIARDFDGHGTGMAVSILSVAPKVKLVCHVTNAPAHVYWRLKHYISTKVEDFYFQALDLAIWSTDLPDDDKRKNYSRRIICNSWGHPVPVAPSADQLAETVQSIHSIREKLEGVVKKQYVICFAAGNAGFPGHGTISKTALTSSIGAIVVGGAYVKPYDATKPPGVFLSDVAHAFYFKKQAGTVFQGGTVSGDGRIPDICGLVGTVYNNAPSPYNGQSPYVYLPSTGQEWSYRGGGTSSACAQIAGICALIRGRYPGISAADVKQLVTQNGKAVELGSSYNVKAQGQNYLDTSTNPQGLSQFSYKDFAPRLKLVDIGEVLKATKNKMQGLNIRPADGSPP